MRMICVITMLLLLLLSLVCAFWCYVEAYKFALPARRWALLGLLFGPLCMPLLWTHQQLNLKRYQGVNDGRLKA